MKRFLAILIAFMILCMSVVALASEAPDPDNGDPMGPKEPGPEEPGQGQEGSGQGQENPPQDPQQEPQPDEPQPDEPQPQDPGPDEPQQEPGGQGAFTTPDTPTVQSKTLTLKKEIKAYNLDETTINAPTISYTYTIAPATVAANTTVTDAVSIHDDTNAVTVPVKAGVGTPTIANSGVVAWTTADQMTAGTDVATGVTYTVATALTTSGESGATTTTTDYAVVWNSAPDTAAAQAETKADYQSTKATITTTANADSDIAYKVDTTNTLLAISPTGVVLRFAPFILMALAAVGLWIVMVRRRRDDRNDNNAI